MTMGQRKVREIKFRLVRKNTRFWSECVMSIGIVFLVFNSILLTITWLEFIGVFSSDNDFEDSSLVRGQGEEFEEH